MSESSTYESAPWYEAKKRDVHRVLIDQLATLRSEQAWRDVAILESLKLYGGRPFGDYGPDQYTATTWASRGELYPTNVVQRIVSTVTSKAVQSRPRPMVATTRGRAELRRRADRMQRWLDGAYWSARVYAHGYPRLIRDAALFGTGFLAVSSAHGKIVVDSPFPAEMCVDEFEALDGCPRSLYRSRFGDRRVLARLFPSKRDAILQTDGWAGASDTAVVAHRKSASQICIVEAWHLPSGPDAGDGRHVIAIDSCALVDEEWTRDSLPIVSLHWETPTQGFWGRGLADIVSGSQITLNELNRTIRNAQRLAGTFRVFLPVGSDVSKAQLNNAPGNIIQYAGSQPPTWSTGSAVPAELYAERRYQIENAYAEAGVSELAVQAQKPAGLNSGKAIRAFADIGSERFARFMLEASDAVGRQLAECMIAEADEMDDLEVVAVGKKDIERLAWSEVSIPKDSYRVVISPGSALPTTPAGRIAAVDDLVNSGLFDKIGVSSAQVGQLVAPAVPDLDTQMALATAPADWIERCLDRIVEGDADVHPEPLMDLAVALDMGVRRYAQAAAQDVDAATLDLLRDWISDVVELQTPPAPPPPPPGAMPPEAGGPPMPGTDLGPPIPEVPPGATSPGSPPGELPS